MRLCNLVLCRNGEMVMEQLTQSELPACDVALPAPKGTLILLHVYRTFLAC